MLVAEISLFGADSKGILLIDSSVRVDVFSKMGVPYRVMYCNWGQTSEVASLVSG